MAITFAILLNEIRLKFFKKTVQTIVYLPHFLSWVVLAAVVVNMVNLDGPINQILQIFGMNKINFLGSNTWFVDDSCYGCMERVWIQFHRLSCCDYGD